MVIEEHAKITPEMMERARGFIDKWYVRPEPYFNTQATRDAIRHYANGCGDMNPLYRDEEYAKKSKYGRLIASPSFLMSIQWGIGMGGAPGLTGIHGWYAGANWEWYRPIYVDEFIPVAVRTVDVTEKAGKMGAGRTVVNYLEIVYKDNSGAKIGIEFDWNIWAERSQAGSAAKYRNIPRPEYSKEEMGKIIRTYENEEKDIRGSNPRYWEEVKIGDKLGPMVRGPLSVRDLVTWLIGAGSPFFRAHGHYYKWLKRHPKAEMYVHETGERDIPELVHILDSFTKEIGIERAYDYGSQRMAWLTNLFTNWMGDDGFLWKMRGDLRVFNQIGDCTWFEGVVKDKYIVDGRCCVEIEAWAKNQRDEYSMKPNPAVVILPSKKYGPVVYPEPPSRTLEELQAQIRTDVPGWFPAR